MRINLKTKRFSLLWNYTSTATNAPGDSITYQNTWSSGDTENNGPEVQQTNTRHITLHKPTRKQRYKNWINTIFFLEKEPDVNILHFTEQDGGETLIYTPSEIPSGTPSPGKSFLRNLFRNRTLYAVLGSCLLGIFISSFGCNQQKLSPEEYIQWIESEKKGLQVSESMQGYVFRLQYKPHPYMLLKQYQGHIPNLDHELQQLAGLQYYNFSISNTDGEAALEDGSTPDLKNMSQIEYFTSNIKKNIYLVENGDTLPCELSYFERNYGSTDGNQLVLGFRENSPASGPADRTFIYNDDVFNTGTIKLLISGSAIAGVPEVRLN